MFAIAPDQRVRSILVIDDEPQIRRAVRNALAPLSERVLEAATGAIGLDLAASARPDLVVLDLALPDMEGEDVCRDIRLWSRMPIIVLSARDSEDEKVKLLRAGADDYVTKPFGLREPGATQASRHEQRAS
jgi:two-component system KDP operon response regulator KdpE